MHIIISLSALASSHCTVNTHQKKKKKNSKSRLVHSHFPEQPLWSPGSSKTPRHWVNVQAGRTGHVCFLNSPYYTSSPWQSIVLLLDKTSSPAWLRDTLCVHVCMSSVIGPYVCAASDEPVITQESVSCAGRRCTSCRDVVKPSGWNSTLQQEEIAYLCVAKGDRKQCVGNSTGIGLPMAHRASRMNNKAFPFTFFVVLFCCFYERADDSRTDTLT